jgi:drug/metabolite transporter (DMT)-like permease
VWNHTLRTLTAVESSVVNNTMTIQIAVLAIVFLAERLGPLQLVGLLLAAAGAAVVQVAPLIRARRGR